MSAQPVNTRMDFIKAEFVRIDKLDGIEDHKVEMRDSAKNALARKAYFIWPDSIDNYIQKSDFKDVDKKIYRDYLFRCLRRVLPKTYKRVDYYEELFHHLYKEVVALHDGNLYNVLKQNPVLSIHTVGMYRYEPIVDSFLCFAARTDPDDIFKYVDDYGDRLYAQHVIDYTAAYAPHVAKKYLLNGDLVLTTLRRSQDTAVKVLLRVNDTYGKRSNAFILLDAIVTGKMTMQEADRIGANPKEYFVALNNIRKKKRPLGAFSIEKELEIQALKVVRTMNDLHNEKDPVRFAGIKEFSTDQLYTLVVYSEEDIFTSTFDGIYRRFMTKLDKQNGMSLVLSMGDNRFRTFIKQFAAYGKLDTFLATTMSVEQRNILMIKFAAGLDQDENDISQAVEVADAYTSIADMTIKRILQQTISLELTRVSKANSRRGVVIYSLLLNLFVNNQLFDKDWYKSVSEIYRLPPLDVMPIERLFEQNKPACVWQLYFYDDEDGAYSFSDFLSTFKDSTWIIEDHDSLYVKIMSHGGKLVDIYANRPKAEYEGQAKLESYFDSLNITPDVLVHRGHSYYAYKTIEKTKPGTKIFVLGSCGGYHNLNNIIDKAPDVSIISSKQIGIHKINNPILRELADNIREGRDVRWQDLWVKIDNRLKGEIPEIYGKFPDYIPPHKNLGAIFIRAYNRYMGL